ncbi:MAG: hypothetical protein GY853_00785 [PVC group bacterium]|nr:hypothetical protein [PVC group bacterium]
MDKQYCPHCSEILIVDEVNNTLLCLVCLREFEPKGGGLVEVQSTIYI